MDLTMWIALFIIAVVVVLLIKFRKKLFRKREKPFLPAQTEMTHEAMTPEAVTTENVKAKMDLVLAQVDSLRTQYETLNQRAQTIESMVREMYNMAKS